MHGDEIIIEGIRCGGGCNPFLNLLENLFLLQVKACTNNRFKAFRWILNGIDNSKLNCAVLDNVRVALISTIGNYISSNYREWLEHSNRIEFEVRMILTMKMTKN